LTNGKQVTAGSCNGIVMGKIPSNNNMVSAAIVFPPNNANIDADTEFTIQVQVDNLQAGSFTDPTNTYYAAPQDLAGNGNIIGHCHVVVQDLNGDVATTTPPPAKTFAFFKGINDDGNGNGLLSAVVAKGLPAGAYRLCTMNSASNHQPVLMPVSIDNLLSQDSLLTILRLLNVEIKTTAQDLLSVLLPVAMPELVATQVPATVQAVMLEQAMEQAMEQVLALVMPPVAMLVATLVQATEQVALQVAMPGQVTEQVVPPVVTPEQVMEPEQSQRQPLQQEAPQLLAHLALVLNLVVVVLVQGSTDQAPVATEEVGEDGLEDRGLLHGTTSLDPFGKIRPVLIRIHVLWAKKHCKVTRVFTRSHTRTNGSGLGCVAYSISLSMSSFYNPLSHTLSNQKVYQDDLFLQRWTDICTAWKD
jgi:hypothetical protein